MYLAPLNYDRYFKKVFSDLSIAKRFLEDFLGIKIREIKYLENKKHITDDTQEVRFDFRCKTDEGYFIIEMQQCYKSNVVKRFYLYHSIGTALQLEDLPKREIKSSSGKIRKEINYNALLPAITIVWMVHDTLKFTDDYICFHLLPASVLEFMNKPELWEIKQFNELKKEHDNQLKIINNDQKGLTFLSKNKLIYAFQPNIVKNKRYAKYYDWFELADKTLKKISDKFKYDKYLKDEILCKVIDRLRKELSEESSEEYILNFERNMNEFWIFEDGVREEQLASIRDDHRRELNKIEEREKEERKQKEFERKQKEFERKQKEFERKQKEIERKQKEEALRQKEDALRQKGEMQDKFNALIATMSAEEIAQKLNISKENLNQIIK